MPDGSEAPKYSAMPTQVLVEILSDPVRAEDEHEAARYELTSRGYFAADPDQVSEPDFALKDPVWQESVVTRPVEGGADIGCWVVPGILVLWLAYVFVLAPTQAANGFVMPKNCTLESQLLLTFPNEYPRIEPMHAQNMDIYIHRKYLDTIPFPDRESAVRSIGKSWDKHTNWYFFSSVRIRDIQTGKDLATYSCTTGWVSLKSDS